MRIQGIRLLACLATILSATGAGAQQMPTMPMGMNPGWNHWWSQSCQYIDVMKTASGWVTFHDGGGGNSHLRDSLEADDNGYPLEIPQMLNGNETRVRFSICNFYEGRYVFLYDGDGDFLWHNSLDHEYTGGKHYITLDGTGGNKYITITRSARGNHVRNIRILPVEMEDTYDPAHPFTQEFLDFLRPFQCIRVRDLMGIDGGNVQVHWNERATPSYYTQDRNVRGASIEHCIQLCNELGADMWLSVPHPAWDDWIINAARLVRDSLKPCLKVYLEYSNELWNWSSSFPQSNWVVRNGRWDAHPEWHCADSIHEGLSAIDPGTDNYPEKDAYMMARLFNIWRPIFEQAGQRDRLVCVAGIQQFYVATTNRILKYLFQVDGGGCDAVGPASYFQLNGSARRAFDAMPEGSVTKRMIYDSAVARLDETFNGERNRPWLLDSLADAFGVGVACYEGGSHMYDYQDHHWSDTLTALHGDSLIYELYRLNFTYWKNVLDPMVNVMLSAIADDYADFAHITDYDQIYLSRDQMMEQAPKYLAITDASAPKRECTVQAMRPVAHVPSTANVQCRLAGSRLSVRVPVNGLLTVDVCTPQGRRVARLHNDPVRAGATSHVRVPVEKLAAGVYLVDIAHQSVHSTIRLSVVK